MKNLLKLEELAQFLLCLYALFAMDAAWWFYPLLALGPDIGLLGYAVNAQVGAITYNLLHHKALALLVMMAGFVLMTPFVMSVGFVLFGHASMDRIFGYGLKFGDNFHHTHLGWIGKGRKAE